jgi:hypothetical protein
MSTERPYAPPDDPNDVAAEELFDDAPEGELDFNRERVGRFGWDDMDIEGEDNGLYDDEDDWGTDDEDLEFEDDL